MIQSTVPKIHCKVFEYNSEALETATTYKYCPRTKYLNVKMHHFCDCITLKEISMNPIDTSKKLSDYLTKLVNQLITERIPSKVMGW